LEITGSQSFVYFGPELALLVTAAIVSVLARFRRLDRSELGELAILGASVSVFLAARLAGWGEVWIFERLLVVDGFAILFTILVGIATVAVLWISLESPPSASGDPSGDHGWSCSLILLAAVGLDLMAAVANLWIAYLAVELASLGLWALSLAQATRPPGGARRAGAVGASLAMLGGVAWLAGFSQSADYERVHAGLGGIGSAAGAPLAAAVAAVLLAFPSRVLVAAWGRTDRASPALDALVAVGFAAAGLAFSVRLLVPVLSTRAGTGRWVEQPGPDWTWLVAVAAGAMMTIGNLGALRERSVRRVLVATAAAHLGYALLGVASATDAGLRAALFYVVASGLAALGAFHAAALIERSRGSDDLDAYRGLLHGSSWPVGIGFSGFLLSLAGVPGLVGFPAKLHVLGAVVEHADGGFAGLALLNCALGFVAYWRVMRRMLERADTMSVVRIRAYDTCFVASLGAAMVGLGLHEEPLLDLASRSIHLLPR
jgi:NADH-quinone oxidoreductase subunit N